MGAIKKRADRIECSRRAALWETVAIIVGGSAAGWFGAGAVLLMLGLSPVWGHVGFFVGLGLIGGAALCWKRATVWNRRGEWRGHN